ncbi:hypothetical protein [Paenibacillus spongiae]|uniref:Uncharacterized protein n=1 Tax=Paenibacillus spongiae TaxID=2909671 RepID=A0ABY5S1T5_9BACL|nr:hypothetical protein [Paenibacillus spongiae]UVI27812.1 hypothetical protein L1F29_20385 [Paenibacillus spongiae]
MRLATIKLAAVLMLAFCFLFPYASAAHADNEGAEALRPVQAFDIVAGKVVKSIPNNAEFQSIADSWIASVTGLSPQVKADDKCGYVFRLPLAQPKTIQAGAATIRTSDLFLFYCPKHPQLLLVFDENRKPYLLQFKADIKPFLKLMEIN